MKFVATAEDGSVNDKFLEIWLRDPQLLRLEFSEIAAA
jgi:hypothetical protein